MRRVSRRQCLQLPLLNRGLQGARRTCVTADGGTYCWYVARSSGNDMCVANKMRDDADRGVDR